MSAWLSLLPSINAGLNFFSTCLLLLGFYFIKQRNIAAHKAAMFAAFCSSALFLTCYLIYHFNVGSVKFQGQGWSRTLYFAILIPHTILAVVNTPLILTTLSRAYKGNLEGHRSVARKTLPLWLYVSVTGVIIYVMLYHLYAPGTAGN